MIDKNPLVTIIMSSYNHEEFVKKAQVDTAATYLRGRVSKIYKKGDKLMVRGEDAQIGQVVEHGIQAGRRKAQQRTQHGGVFKHAMQVHAQHVALLVLPAQAIGQHRHGQTLPAQGSGGCVHVNMPP